MVKTATRLEDCPEITEYLRMVESPDPRYPVCKEQIQLAAHIRKCFAEEALFINLTQLERYLALQEYFPYRLFPWEKYLFTLHNCVYREDGRPRWPNEFDLVGRGAGKNGKLSFEDFALLTPINARFRVENGELVYAGELKNYHIDLFANSEDQAKTSFLDIYNILEGATPAVFRKLNKEFYWNKEVIRNRRTGSELTFRTTGAKSQDSRRPGKVDFDEYHNYENYKILGTARTGLGKKPYPKETITTTNGTVRDGPLDHLIAQSRQILEGSTPDGGILPFICKLDEKDEVHDKRNWHKANPSLRYFPDLQERMEAEYREYKIDNLGNANFMIKRMNLPQGETENPVTEWENIMACSRAPKEQPKVWVAGIDFARTTDFLSVNLFGLAGEEWVWENHSWVCSNCKDLSRIRFPLQDAVNRGLITWVEDVEIPPELPAEWLAEQMGEKAILAVAIDDYRFALMKRALERVGFTSGKEGNIKLVKGKDIMQAAPTLIAQFARKGIAFGDNPVMRWYINNTKQTLDARGNITFGKIEPKTRKTDGFMAAVASATLLELLEAQRGDGQDLFELYVY